MSDRLALLERAQQGDGSAEAQLLTENAGLIWSIVRRYNGCGVETDDLYQLGCIGFVKAVKGFDLTYGTQFSTYAVPKIAGEIRRFLRDDGPIKVGRTMREKGQTLWAARERLQNRLGYEPRLSQLAEETGMTPEEIAAVDMALISPESLQQETAEGLTLESTLRAEEPDVTLVERIALRDAIDALPEKERKTILLRFFKGLTQEQTARILQVSQVQVSRLERRSLQKLRELLAGGARGETGDAPHGGAKPRAGGSAARRSVPHRPPHRQVRRLLFPVFPTRCASVTVRRCPGETDALPAAPFHIPEEGTPS